MKEEDKKLIKLAAKAVNRKIKYNYLGFQHADTVWNPLDNNEDAFKLAVDCCFTVELEKDAVWVSSTAGSNYQLYRWYAGDKQKAVRRAIVKVSALTACDSKEHRLLVYAD